MQLIAINGSTRPKGNTHIALEILQGHLKDKGHELEIIDLCKKKLNPCHACYACKKKGSCVQDDDINEIFEKLKKADGIILASPTYFSNVSSRMAMFIERTGILARGQGNLLKDKVGASIAIARRAGHNVVYAIMNYYFGIAKMTIASSTYWNVLIGGAPGAVKEDEEGLEILENLADSLDKLLK
jgi:multimeric flavodoxin WrbA